MSNSPEIPQNSAQQFVSELLFAGDSAAIDSEVLAFLCSWEDEEDDSLV